MSFKDSSAGNKWFILGLCFLALNAYGIYLLHSSLKGGHEVRVELSSPADSRVAGKDPLCWRFSTDMINPSTTGTVSSTAPVRIDPAIKGSFLWTRSNELTFRPDEDWKLCTDYRANLTGELRSLDLRPVRRNTVFNFHTDSLILKSVNQASYSEDGSLELMLEFNADVSPEHLRSNLSITNAAGKNITYAIDQEKTGRTIALNIETEEPGQLVLHLKAGTQSTTGPRQLGRDVTWNFNPSGELSLASLVPEAMPFGPQSIVASFNGPVSIQAAVDFIKIKPMVKIAVESRDRWSTRNQIRITGDFKAGQSYAINILRGLPGTVKGKSLSKEVTRMIYFPDSAPGVEINAGGNYMSPKGSMIVPFRSVAVTNCHVTVRRIFANNIAYLAIRNNNDERYYYGDGPDLQLGRDIASKDIPVNEDRNTITEHRLALKDLVGDKCGAYYVQIDSSNGRDYRTASHHVIVSDTGLSTKRTGNDVLVWANSIRTLEPLTGATIRVVSAKNQELYREITDAEGLARFTFTTNDTAGTPFVIIAEKGDDITYLPLNRAAVALTGATGERAYLTHGYEAYIFTDRGIYRPGETIHVKAIARGRDCTCPAPFPVRLNIYRPDSKLDRSLSAMLTDYGTAEFSLVLQDFLPTGNYHLQLTLPDGKTELGSTHIAFEEFVPPQIRVTVKSSPERVNAGEAISAEVNADHLFGKAAAGLSAEVRVEFIPVPFTTPKFADYQFGDPEKPFKAIQQAAGHKLLDDEGKAVFQVKSAPEWRPPAAIKAVVSGTVTEMGGRSVTAYAGTIIDAYPVYIGIRQKEGENLAGKAQAFDIVVVNPDGTTFTNTGKLRVSIDKISWISVLRKDPKGVYTYSSEKQVSAISKDEITLRDGRSSFACSPQSEGDCRITVTDPASGASSSMDFYVGIPGQCWSTRSMESPEVIEMKFDKPRYIAGDTATLVAKAPFTGKALVTLESTGILQKQIVTFTNNTAELKFKVETGFAPNVHCFMTLIRPAMPEKIWGQHRAAGMATLVADSPARKLNLSLAAPGEMRPGQKLTVGIETTGEAKKGIPAEVVVAAVDEGICMLTDFKSPDPYRYFFAPRFPEGTLHDFYSLLMPELEKSISSTSSPGGDAIAGLGKRLNPVKARRFKPVALWSPTIMTDSSGKAETSFDVPEFTGKLRLMAVALDKHQFGATEQSVIVKRPLIVQSSLPRFITVSDTFTMPVQVMNETSAASEVVVTLSCRGPIAFEAGATSTVKRIHLGTGTQTNITFKLAGLTIPGKATCLLDVTMGDEHFAETMELPVRPGSGRINTTGIGVVQAGREAEISPPADWVESTGSADLWISSLPGIQLGGSLNYLLQYPYGCLEQTTSKSFPLLFLSDLAGQIHPGWLSREEVSALVQGGIHRILNLQHGDGSFALWQGCDTYVWGSIYATHFLLEAAKAEYNVPEDRITQACEYIEKWLSSGTTVNDYKPGSPDSYDKSYACYVLALAGKPQHGWMARLLEHEDNLDHDTKVNLAAALMASGKRREGATLLERIGAGSGIPVARQNGGSLRSDVRNNAILLSTLLDVDTGSALIPNLVRKLESARDNGCWYTTQENAMSLMALGKYCSTLLSKNNKPATGQVTWNNGAQHCEFTDKQNLHIALADRKNAKVTIGNQGTSPLYFYWRAEGIPLSCEVKEEDCGLKVRRELLDIKGAPVPAGAIRQGDLLVMKVTLESSAVIDNVVVEDLLPAGLEIENANLKTSQTVNWCKDRQTIDPVHTDIRDDRMIAFTGSFSGTQTYFYAVRAVTQGAFVMPPVSATCMYDPSLRSVSGAGKIKVEGME